MERSMMNKGILIATALVLSSGSVMAEPSQQLGVYIAGAAGLTDWDDDNAFSNTDDSDTVWQATAGYKFNGNFAVDARYAWLGEYSVGNQDVNFKAWSVNAVGIIPLPMDAWEIYGQLGLGRINGNGPLDENEALITGGLGARYNLDSNLSLAGGVDFYSFSPDLNGKSYDNMLYTLTAGIQYIFE